MTSACPVSVIVAVEHSVENVAEILSSLNPSAHPEVEFIFCHASVSTATASSSPLAGLGPLPANVTALASPPASRIPHMWRDGLLAAQSEWVALLSAHCVPSPSWMQAVLALQFAPTDAGIGGYLTNSSDALAPDWAIYLLRYVNYSLPRSLEEVSNIAADNAVYRRSEILRHPEILAHGFWEPELHREFFATGFRLRLSATLEVIHRNRYSVTAFARQRRDHGLEFGSDRARRLGNGRLAVYLLASPLIALILFAKVRVGMAHAGWGRQVPFGTSFLLAYFSLHWAFGETCGLAREFGARTGLTSWKKSASKSR